MFGTSAVILSNRGEVTLDGFQHLIGVREELSELVLRFLKLLIIVRAKMRLRSKLVLLFSVFLVFSVYAATDSEQEFSQKLIKAPHKNVGSNVIDGTGTERSFSFKDSNDGVGENKGGNSKVSVSTVALFTLAMAAATGLGAVPFFFVELDPKWAGLCNGMAAGVMLSASFGLIREGQEHGAGGVAIGILAGGIFIWLCKQVNDFSVSLSHMSMLSMLLIIGNLVAASGNLISISSAE